jgi:hypothetical protein
MDAASRRLIEQLTKRLDALTAQFRESQRPKPTSWVQNAVAGSSTGLAKSPVGGIPAQTGITPGFASCSPAELYDDGGTIKIRVVSGADPIVIYNTTSVTSKSEKWIHWKTEGERKVIDVDDCNAGGTTTINGGTP